VNIKEAIGLAMSALRLMGEPVALIQCLFLISPQGRRRASMVPLLLAILLGLDAAPILTQMYGLLMMV
jgi:hypothetical protein